MSSLTTKTLCLSNAEVGKVIGVRGAVVRTIRQQSGASVDIDSTRLGVADTRQITLCGEPSQVEAAEKMIWYAQARLLDQPRRSRLT